MWGQRGKYLVVKKVSFLATMWHGRSNQRGRLSITPWSRVGSAVEGTTTLHDLIMESGHVRLYPRVACVAMESGHVRLHPRVACVAMESGHVRLYPRVACVAMGSFQKQLYHLSFNSACLFSQLYSSMK